MLMVATAAPWVGNGLSIFRVLPGGGVDVTPFAFVVTGVALVLAMSRFRLFSLLPVLLPTARNQVLQKMKDGVLVVDVDGRVVNCNPAAGCMLAAQVSDVVGKPAAEILGDETLAPLATDGGDSQFEITLGEGDSSRHFDVVSSVLGLRGGDGMGRLLVLRDITERKRMEEQLENEVFLRRLLVEQSRDGVVVLEQDGNVYEANQQYARMLGYSMEEVHQLHVWDWDTIFGKEELLEMLETVDDAGDHFETQHRRKDGSLCDVEISTNGVVYGGKKLIFCVCRDVSERKRQEQALRESEERYRVLVDTTSDLIFSFDRNLRLAGINRAAADSLGLTVEAALGRHMADLGLPEATRGRWETHVPPDAGRRGDGRRGL